MEVPPEALADVISDEFGITDPDLAATSSPRSHPEKGERVTDLDLIPETSIGLWQATDFTGVIAEATQAADALGAVVKDRKLTVNIQGRHHVLVEGWTLLGTMLGVQPYVVWSKPIAT